jgi:plastocyanin
MNSVTRNQCPVTSKLLEPVTGYRLARRSLGEGRSLVTSLFLLTFALQVSAQTDITTLNGGTITFDGVETQLEYHVEWTSGLGGTNQFNAHFVDQEHIRATGTTMTVARPQFFRIVGTNKLSNGIYRIAELPTVVTAGAAKINIEWSESANGPWHTNWSTPQEQASEGDVIVVQTPRFFRLSLVTCQSNFASCTDWSDQTDPASNRVVDFGGVFGNNYSPKCLKIKNGQAVTFQTTQTFGSHPLIVDCQEHAAMTNTSSGTSAQFLFIKPGYYNYHCQFHGNSSGGGMAGNIWVIP